MAIARQLGSAHTSRDRAPQDRDRTSAVRRASTFNVSGARARPVLEAVPDSRVTGREPTWRPPRPVAVAEPDTSARLREERDELRGEVAKLRRLLREQQQAQLQQAADFAQERDDLAASWEERFRQRSVAYHDALVALRRAYAARLEAKPAE